MKLIVLLTVILQIINASSTEDDGSLVDSTLINDNTSTDIDSTTISRDDDTTLDGETTAGDETISDTEPTSVIDNDTASMDTTFSETTANSSQTTTNIKTTTTIRSSNVPTTTSTAKTASTNVSTTTISSKPTTSSMKTTTIVGMTTSLDSRISTIDPVIVRCKELNEKRANYSICCKNPEIVMYQEQLDQCRESCNNTGKADDLCCLQTCSFEKIGVIEMTSPGQNAKIIAQGIKNSFLNSVSNITMWQPIVNQAVDRCYKDYLKSTGGIICDCIPNYLFDILDCSYRENFLRCPEYNPFKLDECELTLSFVQECSNE